MMYTIEHREHQDKTSLSFLSLAFILVGTSFYFLYGQFLFPLWVLPLIPISIVVGIYSLNKESILIGIFVLMMTLIELKSGHEFTIFVALTGAIATGLMFSTYAKKMYFPEKYVIGSTEYIFFMLYFVWIILIGIKNLFFLDTAFETWFRDLLLFSPLIAIPPMFVFVDLNKKRDKFYIYISVIIIWLICFVTSIVKVRSSFLAASYLFEVSYGPLSVMAGPFMAFVFFNLYISEKRRKQRVYYFVGLIISAATIFLTHSRTMWVLTPIGIFLTLFFVNKEQRRNALRLFLLTFIFFCTVIGILYVIFPFVGVLVRFFFVYLLSSSNLKGDPSLIGRYVEWRYIGHAIEQSPIVGYGIGATYRAYNWFGGYFITLGYTHNAYLGILHKGGVIGFILLLTSYFGFIKKGLGLMKSKLLTVTEKAFVRAGITVLVLLLFASNTFNFYGHRDVLVYVGLVWGYFMYMGRILSEAQRAGTTKAIEKGGI